VTYKTGLGLDDCIYCTKYILTFRNYRQHRSVAILHTSQFTVIHALGFSAFTSRILATDISQPPCNFKSHVKSSCHILITFLPFLQLLSTALVYSSTLLLLLLLLSKSKSHYDWRSVSQSVSQSVSKSWCRAPSRTHDQIFSCYYLTVTVLFLWGALSDEGTGLLYYMLLGLPNAIFLESESLGNRDHILLSQIWDFPFRRLFRLAESRWRYSTPPPHGFYSTPLTLFMSECSLNPVFAYGIEYTVSQGSRFPC
jgi:hypothetical protein